MPDTPAQTEAPAKPGVHLRYVDGFRGLAALYVVLHHAWLQTWPAPIYGDSPSGLTLALTGWLDLGKFAVTFFIAVSGFCLMLPVLRNDGNLPSGGSRRFFWRRAKRILPPYYAALVLSIVLVKFFISNNSHSLYDQSLPMTPAGVVTHFLLVHNLNDSTIRQISGPLWSIAVECQIYLLFPLLVLVRRRFGIAAVLGGTYILSIALQSLLQATPYRGITAIYLFVFALGMYAAEAALGPRKQSILYVAASATLVMLVLFQRPDWRASAFADIAVGIVSMCLLIICAQWPHNLATRIACWRPIASMGAFSYSLYLIHFPIQQVLWQHAVVPLRLDRTVNFCIVATTGTVFIVACSYAFYRVFERPFCPPSSRAATK